MAVFKNIVQDDSGSAPMGDSVVGYVGHGGSAGFSHKDRATAANYALLQTNLGDTFLNSSSGRNINFRIANSNKMTLSPLGRLGIGTTSPGQPLHVIGNIQSSADVYVGGGLFNTNYGSFFWPESNLGWTARSGNTGQSRIVLKSSTNTKHGSFYGSGGFVSMLDSQDRYAVLHLNGNYTRFYDNGELMFHIGQGHDGDFGSVSTYGNGEGNWEGYSINGQWVFMAPDQNRCSIYSDYYNEFAIDIIANNAVQLFYNGQRKLSTTNNGIKVESSLPVINLTDINSNPDWAIMNWDGAFRIWNDTSNSIAVQVDGNNNTVFGSTSNGTSRVDITGTAMRQFRLRTAGGPVNSDDTNGQEGDFAYDDLYLYVKTGSGWGRIALDFAF